jgi:hypothetical protein
LDCATFQEAMAGAQIDNAAAAAQQLNRNRITTPFSAV